MKKIRKLLTTDCCLLSTAKGFSLIELMVVITIIGIILLFAIPNFAGMQRRARIRAAAQEITQDLRQLRERALSTNGQYRVSFPDAQHYAVRKPDGSTITNILGSNIGGNIHFGSGAGVSGHPPEGSQSAPGNNGIDFPGDLLILDPRGGATSGVIYITDDNDNYAVGINTLGKVRIYRYANNVWQPL